MSQKKILKGQNITELIRPPKKMGEKLAQIKLSMKLLKQNSLGTITNILIFIFVSINGNEKLPHIPLKLSKSL